MSIIPREDGKESFIAVDRSMETVNNTSQITTRQISQIKNGTENALLRGPKVGCPVNEIFSFLSLQCLKAVSMYGT